MTTTSPTANELLRPRTSTTSLLGGLTSWATSAAVRAWNAFMGYRAFRASKAQLEELDAQTLKDIGIDRSEIESVLMDSTQERRRSARPSTRVLSFLKGPTGLRLAS